MRLTARKASRIALAAVAAGTLGLLALSIGSCVATPELGVADGRLRPCPSSPNCVGSEDPDPGRAIAPFALRGDPDASFARLVELVGAGPRTELVAREDGYARFEVRTALLRFTDDLELRIDRAARVAHVRSASRVGRSDLGANRRRVEALRALWEAEPR